MPNNLRNGKKEYYKPGSWWRICDVSGMKIRAENTKKQWNNLIVREQSFEMRHPQDFVTGVRDDQNVSDPRPRQADQFINSVGPNASEFEVYGDNPPGLGPSFLVQNNQGPAYNPGLNSAYTNPNGTSTLQVLNGTIPPILPQNYPGNGQGPSEE